MKDLFDPALVEHTRQRLLQLQPESARQWGSLGLAATLAHCTAGFEMAMGEIQVKRAAFPGSLIGRLIKPLVFRDDQPMRRNSPSMPELFVAGAVPFDFEAERARLIAALDRFATGGAAGCTRDPHPFFGPLTAEQWAILMYKHLDHHLRQFGA